MAALGTSVTTSLGEVLLMRRKLTFLFGRNVLQNRQSIPTLAIAPRHIGDCRLYTMSPSAEVSEKSYKQPSNGLISILPAQWIPYAELARVDKPVACLYLYFPCIFGTSLAASTNSFNIPPTRFFSINLIFLVGCFTVRCAGCTWNDIVDQDLDRKVSRTRLRPIARRAISTPEALVFVCVQVLVGLILCSLVLPIPCLYHSIPSILLTGLYPYGKRFTNYPQIILGLVFSWGVILAFPALELDLFSSSETFTAAASFFLSCVTWTLSYDTIYAAQDVKDDLQVGIKSPVTRHGRHTRLFLWGAALVQVTLLCTTGFIISAPWIYFVLTCAGAFATLAIIVANVDLKDPGSCNWWFKHGCVYTGVVISSGMISTYLIRYGEQI